MTFSVLMSVYKNDNADFLKQALDSIYEVQTRKPDEIVIVFDGLLTEDLYKTVNDFCALTPDIVKIVKSEKNQGLGKALKLGSQNCSCDYIARMDSDDISHPQRFEKQMRYLEENSEFDVLGTDISEFDFSTEEDMRVRQCPEEHCDIVKMAKRRNPMNHVSVFIKRSALEKCGGYEDLLLLEDYYLWLKMIVAGCTLKNINESLVYVRVGNGFDKKRGSKIRIKGWKALQKYMLKNKMISLYEAITNMCFIYGFVYCPKKIRHMVYNKFLRK